MYLYIHYKWDLPDWTLSTGNFYKILRHYVADFSALTLRLCAFAANAFPLLATNEISNYISNINTTASSDKDSNSTS